MLNECIRRYFFPSRAKETKKQKHKTPDLRLGGGGWNPSQEFLICCNIWKRFCLQWKAFDLLYKMRYILWVVVMLTTCDITNNDGHIGFYQELEIRLKLREMVFFFYIYMLDMNNNT